MIRAFPPGSEEAGKANETVAGVVDDVYELVRNYHIKTAIGTNADLLVVDGDPLSNLQLVADPGRYFRPSTADIADPSASTSSEWRRRTVGMDRSAPRTPRSNAIGNVWIRMYEQAEVCSHEEGYPVTPGNAVGRVAHLDVTAVKGLAVVDAERITVTDTGVLGNREFFFVEPDGRLYSVDVDSALLPYSSRYEPTTNQLTIGDGRSAVVEAEVPLGGEIKEFDFESSPRAGRFVAGPWDAWASSVSGRSLALVQSVSPGGAYDVYPLTFQSEASLAALGPEADGTPMDRRRFRMQITLSDVDAAFVEDDWAGRSATLGTCRVRMGGPVPRCVGTEHHPADLSRTVKILRTINRIRGVGHGEFGKGLMFGVYASVIQPGDVAVGDRLVLDSPIASGVIPR